MANRIIIDQLLKSKCKSVSIFEANSIISKLNDALISSNIPGIGLAAPQIGIDAQVCIIRLDRIKIDLVNPIIVDRYDLKEFYNEGCLSFPNKFLTTKRYAEVVVKDDLRPAGFVSTGIEAVVVQHEIGHLFGETMFDYEIKIPQSHSSKCWCGSNKKYKSCHYGKVIR